MPVPIRGFRTIRTWSGRVDRVCVPHRAYLQIAWLEIEKLRRAAERTSAMRRLAELDARLHAIDAEEATLTQALADRKRLGPDGSGVKLASRRSAGVFRIRY